jgi:hypothetical protein
MTANRKNHYIKKSYEKISEIYAEFAVFCRFFDLFPFYLSDFPKFPVDEKGPE